MTFLLGHHPMGKRPNVRNEIARIKRDPLDSYFLQLDEEPSPILSSNISRYQDAYDQYFLAFRRFLHNMSVVARYMNSAHYKRKYGGAYTPYEKQIASRYRELSPYTEFDITNCLLYARILLDRVASLSRRFLCSGQLPSFTSFSDHKKFFQKLANPYGAHEEYARYIRTNTDWFEMPLKEVRDKYVVHSAPKHMRFVGLPNNFEVELVIIRADGNSEEKPLARTTTVILNPLRMSYQIEEFLNWFSAYAASATRPTAALSGSLSAPASS